MLGVRAMATYNDDTMVGFVMCELNNEEKELYLCRLLVDEHHRQKGYGKDSLDLIGSRQLGRAPCSLHRAT